MKHPGNLFRLQLAADNQGRRVVLRTGLTLLLALPFMLARMPARVQGSGLAAVLLFTSVMGSAVATAKMRADGRIEKLRMLPVSRLVFAADLALAWSLSRLAPFVIAVCVFFLLHAQGLSVLWVSATFGFLSASAILLTAFGMLIGRLGREGGEVHLFGALGTAAVAALSGLVPLPERIAGLAAAAEWNPLRGFASLLTCAAEGRTPPPPLLACGALMFCVLATLAVWRWFSGGRRRRTSSLT